MPNKPTILITGGAGYVGSVLTDRLIRSGNFVRVFDRGYFGFDHLNKIAEVVKGDTRNPPEDLMEKVDAVVHLAAFSNDPTADYDPVANWTMNYEGTKKIADMAKENGIKRFVEASTCSCYYRTGEIPEKIFDEGAEIKCEAPYPKSKKAAEDYLLSITDRNFKPIILRKGTIYGVSPRMRYDLVLNTFVKDAFLKGEIKIHAEGKLERPILSLTEAVDVYQKILNAPLEKVGGQIWNVVGENIKIMDLAFKVYKTLLEKRNTQIKLDIWRYDEGVIRSYKVSCQKLNKLFPQRKKQSIEDAIVEMWDDLVCKYNPDDPIYYNIRNLEELKKYEDRLNDLGSVL